MPVAAPGSPLDAPLATQPVEHQGLVRVRQVAVVHDTLRDVAVEVVAGERPQYQTAIRLGYGLDIWCNL